MDQQLLPDAWVWLPLAELAEISAGNPAPQGEDRFYGGTAPFVRVQDMGRLGENRILRETADKLNSDGAMGLKMFPAGTVLLTKSGASTLLNQRAILGQDSYVVSHIATVTPKSITSPNWLYYFLKTVDAAHLAHGGNMPSLPLSKIKNICAPLPPLNEQRRIVEKIETLFARLDAGEAALKKVQTLLARYRQSVLKAAVTGELTQDWRVQNAGCVESGHDLLQRILKTRRDNWQGRGKYKEPIAPDTSGLPKLPEGWAWASLDQLSAKIVDGTHHTPTYEKSGIAFLSVKDIRDEKLFFDDCKFISHQVHEKLIRRCFPEKGDVLITKSGTIGRTAIVNTERSFSLFVSVALIKPTLMHLNKIIKIGFDGWFQSVNVANDITGTAIKNLHLVDLKQIALPLPSIDEQDKIIERINDDLCKMSSMIHTCQSELARSKALRQSILKQAFAGRLVPQDPNDEPASELLARIRAERQSISDNKRRRSSTLKKQA